MNVLLYIQMNSVFVILTTQTALSPTHYHKVYIHTKTDKFDFKEQVCVKLEWEMK